MFTYTYITYNKAIVDQLIEIWTDDSKNMLQEYKKNYETSRLSRYDKADSKHRLGHFI